MIPTTEGLISLGAPVASDGLIGFGTGYLLKKLIKLAFIALGLIALLLGCLEYQKWILVNWGIVENQTSTIMTQATHKAYVVTQNMAHELPIGAGVLGFTAGLILGLTKG
jgi:uncharacterized membrane protein (Fun14 family)